ncbi:MAG: dynamin family protein [Polyangiaceae bacterium]|nr:dynamin family protein [Polyangiaceae bacterium]
MLETFHTRRDEVIAALSDLQQSAESIGAKSLAHRIDADLVQKLSADRFHLVVVGEFNHGKTTFVNSLLGNGILPVGVTPTTAVIHHLEHSETPRAHVVFESGKRHDVPFDRIKQFAVGGDRASLLGGEHSADGAGDDVKYLEVGFPAELLRERIVLVDTPGVNDLSLQRADITYSYIPKSDAVLFLLDAGQPLKESERVFLTDKLLGQSRDKIIFVVTKCDIWSDEERAEALAYIRNELSKLVKNPMVFPVSAERALEGNREASGMPELLDHLTRFLAEERGRILLDNALGEGVDAADLLRRGIDARRRALAMSSEELTRRIEALEKDLAGQHRTIEERRSAIREEIAAIKAWVKRDLDHFVDDVTGKLPKVIEESSTRDLKLHLGAFLQKTFAEWAQEETREIAAALEQLAEKTIALVRDDAHDVAKRVGDTLGGDLRTPEVTVDRFKYDVGIFALFAGGLGLVFTNPLVGGVLLAASPVLAVFAKSKFEKEAREKAKEMAPKAIREAADRIGPKLDEMISEFAARLDQWVVTAGQELHREVIEVLRAARGERSEQVPALEAGVKECDHKRDQLDGIMARLQQLRMSLQGPLSTPSPAVPVAEVPSIQGGPIDPSMLN